MSSGIDIYPPVTATAVSSVPPGALVDFAGLTAPGGWLLCDGSAVSRATYAALFTAIGTLYGAGDGSTTFNLPDTRGRVTVGVGQGSGLTNRGMASAGGAQDSFVVSHDHGTHGHGATNTVSSDDAHSWGAQTGDFNTNHSHLLPHDYGGLGGGGSLARRGGGDDTWSGGANTGHSHYVSGGTGGINANHTHDVGAVGIPYAGSAATDGRMQPYLAVNKIIKV